MWVLAVRSRSRLFSSLQKYMSSRPKVCIIGAGAAGLATARALVETTGAEVVIFEQRTSVGGIWNRDAAVKAHENPVYDGLGMNLPRELMAFWDLPFEHEEDDPIGSFVPHAAVQRYLQRYAHTHGLEQLVRFGTRVSSVEQESSTRGGCGRGCDS